MSVGKICSQIVQTTSPNEKVHHAARRMREHNVGTLVVVDLAGTPTGLITDRDIAMRCAGDSLDPQKTTVSQIMTSPVATVHERDSIETAVAGMATTRVRRLVVVDDANRMVGLLSMDDILELLVKETASIGELLHAQSPV